MSNAKATHTKLIADVMAARRAGVPIVAIETADQAATIGESIVAVTKAAESVKEPIPAMVSWDAVRGLRSLNKAGEAAIAGCGVPVQQSILPVEALLGAERFPENAVLFMMNAQRVVVDVQTIQAVWNLRDQYKTSGRTVFLLGPYWKMPEELKHDVVKLRDPLPGRDVLASVVAEQYQNADMAKPSTETIERGVDAVQGLSRFEAEQQAAMSMKAGGMDIGEVWERKCNAIADSADGGLRIERVAEGFAQMGGCEEAIAFAKQLIAARWFKAVWFIDEIEKDMAAMKSDTSGTTQFQHKALLTYTQKHKVPALLLIGQPGSGKTLLARSIAGEAGVPLAEMNMGALKGSHVGDTEQNTNRALETLTAISQGELLLVATCNDVGALAQSPELLRRFKLPKFYFDLPTAEERDRIWVISGERYGVDVTSRPNDKDWTGSEIDSCCETAGRLKIAVTVAAKWIIPMAESSSKMVEERRAQAEGNYLSASVPGKYTRQEQRDAAAVATTKQRRIAVEA